MQRIFMEANFLLMSFTAVNGDYTEWTLYNCSVTCGGGVGTFKRTCTNPPPTNGGKNCSELGLGPANKTASCNEQECRKFFLVSFGSFLILKLEQKWSLVIENKVSQIFCIVWKKTSIIFVLCIKVPLQVLF